MSKFLKIILFIFTISFVTSLNAQTVYKTETGKKYHDQSCRYLKYSKIELDLKKAQQQGYVACLVCKPPSLKTQTQSQSNVNIQSNDVEATSRNTSITAVQCSGKTKAGKRCKRRTKSSNGRCYQH